MLVPGVEQAPGSAGDDPFRPTGLDHGRISTQ